MPRFIVPFNFAKVFTPHELHDLQRMGMTPEWILEFVLYIWEVLVENQDDRVYDVVCETISESFIREEDYENESLDSRASVFSVEADRYIYLIKQTFEQMFPYLQDLPKGEPGRVLDTMTLDNYLPNAVVINFVFEDHDEPIVLKDAKEFRFTHYPPAFLAEPQCRPVYSDKSYAEFMLRNPPPLCYQFDPVQKSARPSELPPHLEWDPNEFDFSKVAEPLSPEMKKLLARNLRMAITLGSGIPFSEAQLDEKIKASAIKKPTPVVKPEPAESEEQKVERSAVKFDEEIMRRMKASGKSRDEVISIMSKEVPEFVEFQKLVLRRVMDTLKDDLKKDQ